MDMGSSYPHIHGIQNLDEERKFRWIINNFDIIKKDETLLKTQQFEFKLKDPNGAKSCWKAWLDFGVPKEVNNANKPVVLKIRLVQKPNSVSEIQARITVILIGAKFHKYYKDMDRNHCHGRGSFWVIDDHDPKNWLELDNGRLPIIITLNTSTNLHPHQSAMENLDLEARTCPNRHLHRFCQINPSLENNEENSDVKIISGDGKEFYAYRWILSAVSDVFEAMFRSDMTEKKTGIVKFDDLSGETVKLLLHFVYTGDLGKEWTKPGLIEEIVYASDKLQIEDLKKYMDANLGKACAVENAGNLLVVAEKTGLKKAEVDILAFIKKKCKNSQGFIDILKHTTIN